MAGESGDSANCRTAAESLHWSNEPGRMRLVTINLKFLACLLALLGSMSPAGAASWSFDGVGRVVAISDVHGAYDAMVTTLQNADVIDADKEWVAGSTHLVVTGDILDRGPDSRKAMDLLMRLETEAPAAGGRVHVLIGNHEAMNLTGDLRYVSVNEYAAFANDETPAQRERWRLAYAERDEELTDEAFDERFPPGFFAHRRAMRADGKYGRWLLAKPVIVVINGTAFVHGGIHPSVVESGLDGINGKLVDDLRQYVTDVATLTDAGLLLPGDSSRDHVDLLNARIPTATTPAELIDAMTHVRQLDETSMPMLDLPLWYRGNVGCSRVIEEHRLADALQRIGATRLVIGHTPTASRQVLQRFDGMIVEIDTGMLKPYYDGKGHALIIEGDDLTIVTESGAEFDDPFAHPRRVGIRPAELTAQQIEDLLSTGEVVSQRTLDLQFAKRTIVDVSDGEHTLSAIFVPRPKKGFYPNLAAYRLDKLLGLGMVPVAVQRKLGRKNGSLHYMPVKTVDESVRSGNGRGGSAWCPLNDQWQAMYVFDALIYNEGRSRSRMLYSTDRWQLILVEHQDAFAAREGLPRHLENATVIVSEGWRDALRALDNAMLQENLGDVLDKRRLKALAARRENLLASAGEP